MIRILTGPIRSYKTTTLLQWTDFRDDVGGVLTPDIDGVRMLYNVRSKEYLIWQKAEQIDPDDVVIGRFVFDGAAFRTAMQWLDDHLDDPLVHTIILDEIGPLELQGRGWDSWLQSSMEILMHKDVIFVVRETLVEKVIDRYGLNGVQVVNKEVFAL